MAVVSIFICKSCGKYLVLDNAVLSKNGKKIPLDEVTKKPHNCPNKPFNEKTRHQWWAEQQRKAEEARKEYERRQQRQRAEEEAREKARKEYEDWQHNWRDKQEAYDEDISQKRHRERQRRAQRQRQQRKDDNDNYKRRKTRDEYARDQQQNLSKYHRYAQILGVAMNAKKQQVEEAYRTMALKVHPDRNKGVPWEVANEQFIQLVEAYQNFPLRNR